MIISKIKNLFGSKNIKQKEMDPFSFYSAMAGSLLTSNNAYETIPPVKMAVDFVTRNANQLRLGFYNFETNEEIFPDDKNVAKLLALFADTSFISECVGYLVYRGECFISLAQSWGSAAGIDLPLGIKILNPAEMTAYTDADGNAVKWLYRTKTFLPGDIIHIRIFDPDNSVRGFDTQRGLQDLLKSFFYSTKSAAKFYENGSIPEFALSTGQSLSKAQIDDLKTGWENMHKGIDKSHGVAILSAGLEPKQLSQGTTMPQIQEAKANEERILSYFYAQKALLNLTDTTNYATFQGQMRVFWQCTVMPLVTMIQDALNQRIVTPFSQGKIELRFKYDNVPALAEDYAAKITQAKDLVAMGWPLNAVNDKLNLGFEPVPWGDTQWINFGLMPITDYSSAMNIPADNSSEGKTFKNLTKEMREVVVWKKFIFKQGAAEIKMSQKLGGFLQAQKERVIKNLKAGISTDWAKEEKEFNKAINPLILAAVKDGIELGKVQIPTKSINQDSVAAKYIKKAAKRIANISQYTREAVDKVISSGLSTGKTTEEIADDIKPIFDKSRARKIARTEATGAVNGGTNEYFAELQAKKTWLTSMDGKERESHADINGETVDAGDTFSNGLEFPGDPQVDAPEETVNCRCTILGNIGA